MNTLTKHEISSVAGGDFNLYCDPFIPERILPAPASPVGIPVPPERWPICPFQPEEPSAY
jgi:hypothetical protein